MGAFTRRGLSMPEFELRPKGAVQKLIDPFVHKTIKVDTHPQFSQRYELLSPDKAKIRQMFAPALVSFLESLDQDWNWRWRLEGLADTNHVSSR